jgi:hypothetical protein
MRAYSSQRGSDCAIFLLQARTCITHYLTITGGQYAVVRDGLRRTVTAEEVVPANNQATGESWKGYGIIVNGRLITIPDHYPGFDVLSNNRTVSSEELGSFVLAHGSDEGPAPAELVKRQTTC